MKPQKSKLSRRGFLIAAGVGSAGAAAALVAGGNAKETAVPVTAAVDKPQVKGYHLSAHIAKYYKTTLI